MDLMLAMAALLPYAAEIIKQIIKAGVAALTATTLLFIYEEARKRWKR